MSVDDEGNELLSLLQNCEIGMSWQQRSETCRTLLQLIESQRVRDVDKLPRKIYTFIIDSLRLGWEQSGEKYAQACWTGLVALPEFEQTVAGDCIDDGFLEELCGRFQAGVPDERAFLRDTLHWAYASFPQKRRFLRRKIGGLLAYFVRTPRGKFHIAEVLQCLRLIIKGFPSLSKVHRSLLTEVLLPLHEPNQMAVWSIQQPLIESYHEDLVGCLVSFLELQPDMVEVAFTAIATAWPQGFNSNTPKEVLLLHEVGTLIRFVPPEASSAVLNVIMPKILGCLRVENSRVVERALYLFKDEHLLDVLAANTSTTFLPLLSALLRGGEPFWNPTVNKATRVLESLEDKDGTAFAAACESLWGQEPRRASDAQKHATPTTPREVPSRPQSNGSGLLPPTTLKGAMGNWRPAVSGTGRGSDTRTPPAAITGVAPWAFKSPKPPTRLGGTDRLQTTADGVQRIKPPVQSLKRLRLGVPEGKGEEHSREGDGSGHRTPQSAQASPDPSLASQRTTGSSSATSASSGCQGGAKSQIKSVPPVAKSGVEDPVDAAAAMKQQGPGLRRVREFILKIAPNTTEESLGPSWQELQLEPTPTLLPELRFHDLVFGHELGSGSFSVVKYARHITKGRSRSQWPEFAVKIISTTKIQELNYERSVTNEIACLRMFSHPGIARLVSAFRWRDGAYLVLEYASRGDLHSHIKEHGSLSEASTRFVVGEVVAALCSIHNNEFVFGDLKPENILITESGHIKVADFGACRPVSEAAKSSLNSSRDALRTLRDGDWRVAAGLPPNPLYTVGFGRKDGDTDSDSDVAGQDGEGVSTGEEGEPRAEGTAAYMPPEVARGGSPGFGADAWALGCVTFLCLSGRPPIFAETDEKIMARIVRFSSGDTGGSAGGGGDHPVLPPAVSESPRLFVHALMEPDPKIRLVVEHAAKHEFLATGGTDVFLLHRQKPVELAQGAVAPNPHAAWSRRQNSMIWAPMPQEYRFDAVPKELAIIVETEVERGGAFGRHVGGIREPPVAGA
ncbi:unnamed protein product [Ectocarpus fasciculatus]